MRNRRRYGMTLPELIISATLFIGISAMMAYGVKMYMDATEFGNRVREAHQLARDSVARLSGELRTAAALPTVGMDRLQMPSGVLWPDSYGNTYNHAFYPVQTLTQADGTTVQYAQNRVIFTRPGTDVASTTFNPATMTSYMYVEWIVPSQAPNRILRRLHRITSGVGGNPLGHAWGPVPAFLTQNPGSPADQWAIIPSYFEGGLGLLNPKAEDQVVAQLPGAADSFKFTVAHKRYLSDLTGQPGMETGYGTSYDRNLFDIRVEATVKHRNDPNKVSVQEMKGQARIQSGQ